MLDFEIKFKTSKSDDEKKKKKKKDKKEKKKKKSSSSDLQAAAAPPLPFTNLSIKTVSSKHQRRPERTPGPPEPQRRIENHGKQRMERGLEKGERRPASRSPPPRHLQRPASGRQRAPSPSHPLQRAPQNSSQRIRRPGNSQPPHPQMQQRPVNSQPPQNMHMQPRPVNSQLSHPQNMHPLHLSKSSSTKGRFLDNDRRINAGKKPMNKPSSDGRLNEMPRGAPRQSRPPPSSNQNQDFSRRPAPNRVVPHQGNHPGRQQNSRHGRRPPPAGPSSGSVISRPATNIFNGAINGAMEKVLSDSVPENPAPEKDMESRIAEMLFGKLMGSNFNAALTSENSVPGTANSSTSSSSGPPSNNATIVLTDVQGSTSLWEADPQAMQTALDIHDKILRQQCAAHNGYEIDTEGDAFFLAFHTPSDAFNFGLKAQIALFEAEWSDDILKISAAEEDGCFRGLRVRMGIHHGPVKSCKNEVTGRTEYVGEAMNIAKCVEGMTHGGQILTTFETWNSASNQGGSNLELTQVVDLGYHALKPKGSEDDLERRIIQLVPESLAFDYFAARRRHDDAEGTTKKAEPEKKGRQFDPPITEEQVAASFHDAPHVNHEVTIAFIYFNEIENQFDDPKPIVSDLIRLVGDLLVGTPGYHSQSNMLAFPDIAEAVEFGLNLLEELREKRLNNTDLSDLVKFGCVHDTFITMGPHKTTGRADYFGKVVNRAARITAKSDLGTVNFGVLADTNVKELPKLKDRYTYRFKGVKELKGVQEDMALYEVNFATKGSTPLGLSKKSTSRKR
mmetsp:Transcript_17700/g.26812  ORF Transcript_17700/g.26812 Transcript_17700/m.26812 type:complete len:788 (+) Transcript_17700:3-2366(+)